MFDNLRDDANSFRGQEQALYQPASDTVSSPLASRPSRFLGMTSIQRFVISIMLMAAVCVLGLMCLLVTGKIAL
jgi:hypothetical protein